MSQTKTYSVKGMHCASCASIIERTFQKIPGVESAQVNYGTEKVRVAFDETQTTVEKLSEKIEPLGYTLVIPDAQLQGLQSLATQDSMSENEHAVHL